MPKPPALLAFALTASLLALAGCTSFTPAAKVERDGVGFPVLSSVNGVTNATGGNLTLAGASGVRVVEDATNATVVVGLGRVVQAHGVLQSCRGPCESVEVPEGAVLAEGSLISFNNASLNALGPDRDSSLYFFDGGRQTGQSLTWNDTGRRFEASAGLETRGNLTSRGYLGTFTPLGMAQGVEVGVMTTTTESLEPTVYFRGTARTANGTAVIEFPVAWQVLLDPNGFLTAQVTLRERGPDLFVADLTPQRLVVETLSGAKVDLTFDFLVHGTRTGATGFQALRSG